MNKIKKAIRYFIYKFYQYHTYEVLIPLIKENDFTKYVEVGVWKGKTFFEITKNLPNVFTYGVDPYKSENYKNYSHSEPMNTEDQERYDKIKGEVNKRSKHYNNCKMLFKTSEEASKLFSDKSLDIVYIDGLHDYNNVSKDIKLWLPKVRVGGILCGHDFNLNHFAVVKAVDDILGCDNILVKGNVNMWIYKKENIVQNVNLN